MNEATDNHAVRLRAGDLVAAGAFREAKALCADAMVRGESDPHVFHLHARLRIMGGDSLGGLRELDELRRIGLFGEPLPRPVHAPRWRGEPLAGKTLCFVSEGGVGDIVCFSRFARAFAARGARVLHAVQSPMIPLVEMIEGAGEIIDKDLLGTHKPARFDYWTPGISAPLALELEPEQVAGAPFMRAHPATAARWRALVEEAARARGSVDALRVGLYWQGTLGYAEDHMRSIPAQKFASFLDTPNALFYKLKMWEGENALDDPRVIDITHQVYSPSDLAAFIGNLDLVITVDSAPVHLGGALGVETWLLNRFFGWFIFMHPRHGGRRTPWYDSVRVYTQKKYADWAEPLEEAAQDLRARAATFRRADAI